MKWTPVVLLTLFAVSSAQLVAPSFITDLPLDFPRNSPLGLVEPTGTPPLHSGAPPSTSLLDFFAQSDPVFAVPGIAPACSRPSVTAQSSLVLDSRPYFLVIFSVLGQDALPCAMEPVQLSASSNTRVLIEDTISGESVSAKLKPKKPYHTETNVYGKLTLRIPLGFFARHALKAMKFTFLHVAEIEMRTDSMPEGQVIVINPDLALFSSILDASAETITALAPTTSNETALSTITLLQTIVNQALLASPEPVLIYQEISFTDPTLVQSMDHPYISLEGNSMPLINSETDVIHTHLINITKNYGGYERNLPSFDDPFHLSFEDFNTVKIFRRDAPNSTASDILNSPALDADMSNMDTVDHSKHLVKRVGTIGNKLVAWLENQGAVGQFIVKTVSSAIHLIGKILKTIGIPIMAFIEAISKKLHLDAIWRTHAFLDHFVLVRRSHIRDSLAFVNDKFSDFHFNSSKDHLQKLDEVISGMSGNKAASMPLKDLSVDDVVASSKATPNTDYSALPSSDLTVRIRDTRTTFLETSLLSSLQHAEVVDEHTLIEPFKRLQKLSGSLFKDTMTNFADEKKMKILATQPIFTAGSNPMKRGLSFFLKQIRNLYSSFSGIIASAGHKSMSLLSELNDIFYDILSINLLFPTSIFSATPMKLTLLQFTTLFSSPFVYYQYRFVTGREPVSQSDLDRVLTVTDATLLRATWNTDNPTPEVMHHRDTVIDWAPRALLTTMTWSCVAWLHAEVSAKQKMTDALDVESYNKASNKNKALKWSRLFTAGPVGYLMGVLVYPVNDAAENTPESAKIALTTPYMHAWGMWSWWTFPVLWKSAAPVRTAVQEHLLHEYPTRHGKINAAFGRAESIITGVPMTMAFSTIMHDLLHKTNWKSPKRATVVALSYTAWAFDGLSYFLSEPAMGPYVWKVLWSMCGFYQARLNSMMVLDVVGLLDPPPATLTDNGSDTGVPNTQTKNNDEILGSPLDVVSGPGSPPPPPPPVPQIVYPFPRVVNPPPTVVNIPLILAE